MTYSLLWVVLIMNKVVVVIHSFEVFGVMTIHMIISGTSIDALFITVTFVVMC